MSFLAASSMVIQILLPAWSVIPQLAPAVAQELSATPTSEPTPTETETPAPTSEPTLNPTPTETVTPAPDEKVSPTVTPTGTDITPTETETPTPTQEYSETPSANSEPPKETSPPPENGQILDGVSTTATPTKTPAHTEEGQLDAVILENTKATSLNLDNIDPSASATLTTDKTDYAPTDTAVITGTGFTPNETYTLTISSNDPPATSTTVQVTADENGQFVYAYQLDGTYRPNYTVTATRNSTTVATTSFTDAPISGTTVDSGGANDLPGQKDLTQMSVNYAGLPTSIFVTWSWDEIKWTGNNTGDGCSLFDTDNDGLVNYSLCVIISGNPATYQSKALYSCGDGANNKCTSPVATLSPSSGTTCSAASSTDDPFATGDEYPKDTKAQCTIALSDVGGASVAQLVDVCSYPSQQPNSDPSDCIVFKVNSGKLEVVKNLVPASDSGLFNLQIDGTTQAANVGNNGTTGEKVITVGNHTVGETAGTNTILSSYTSAIDCRDLNGTGNSVASSTTNGPLTVNVTDNADIVCTITNTRNQGTLRVIKNVINDNGGAKTASDFSFQVNGGGAVAFEADGQNDLTVAPGTYSVTEPAVSGYATTYNNCTNVTVASGGITTCTITNNDIQPILTVTKVVVNDNGGTKQVSDFPLFVDATPVTSGVQNGFNAGAYTVSETQASGYTSTVTGDCSSNGSVTLAIGDTKSCTITNNDVAPTLTLVKTVINNNGGNNVVSDFTLKIDSTTVTSGVPIAVNAGTHTASEISLPGYTPSAWGGDCDTNGSVTLNPGDAKTCTITNDDVAPTITLTKQVTNDNGGTAGVNDFGLTVGGSSVTSGQVVSASANTPVDLNETGAPGYSFVSITGDAKCPQALGGAVTLTEGENVSCTITNDDDAPTLTLVKQVTNDDGGTAAASAFTLTATGTSGFSGSGPSVSSGASFDAGTYDLSESGPAGYTGSAWTCVGGSQSDSDTVVVGLGDDVTCTITNNDNAPTLKLVKSVVNDNGGNQSANNWTLTATGTGGFSDAGDSTTFHSIHANTAYTLSESSVSGYTAGNWSCDGGSLQGNVLTLALDEDVTCTITNNDQPGTLIVKKIVVNDNGGDATADDFSFSVNAGASQPFEADGQNDITVNAGTYSITESETAGYTTTYDNCSNVAVPNGGTATCTITNDDQPGTLIVKKVVVNDDGGTATASSFSFRVNGGSSTAFEQDGQNDITVNAGSYSITENTAAGYETTYDNCTRVAIPNGGTATCTITNDDIAPTLTLVKNITNDNGGTASASLWTLSASGSARSFSGTTPASGDVLAGVTYALEESGGPSGYTASDWDCNGGTQVGNTITLGLADSVTCTIVNNDQKATLILSKTVLNDNGGNNVAADFDVYIGTTQSSWGSHEIDAGTYTVHETSLGGYTASGWGLDCNAQGVVTLLPGETKTCTIVNDDEAPTITLVKNVVNDDGGSAGVNDFGLSVGGTAVTSGQTLPVNANTPVALNEASLAGYQFTDISGDRLCPSVLGGTVTLSEGQDITCTITNNDIAPQLTVTKVVVGGNGKPSDFDLFVDQTQVTSGQTNSFDAGSYIVSEGTHTGYTSEISGDCDANGNVTLALADEKSCTITNTRDTGGVVVHKIIDIDGNLQTTGDQGPGENWEMSVDGTGPDTSTVDPKLTDATGSASFASLKTGEYTVSETTKPGYDLVSATCTSGSADGATVYGVAVTKGETTECTFINSPNGAIHGRKWNDEDAGSTFNGEEGLLGGWEIQLYKFIDDSYVLLGSTTTNNDTNDIDFGWYWFKHLFPGEYKVCEVNQASWAQTYPSTNGGCHLVTLPDDNPGNFDVLPNFISPAPAYDFGNVFINPDLTIAKTNDTGGADRNPGANVLFTITVTATQSAVNDVIVKDLPSLGFTYHAGSATAVSSVRGALSGALIHEYASPGIWDLGDMVAGETVTLTYQADISSSIQSGLYRDLAWAQGSNILGGEVVANDDTGVFVGTDVNIVRSDTSGTSINVVREGQVLGASTELPATGASALWLLVAGVLGITGASAMGLGLLILHKRRLHA